MFRIKNTTPLIFISLIYAVILFINTSNTYPLEDVGFDSELLSGLEHPVDVAVSSKGELFVLDDKLSMIRKFDSYGGFVKEIGAKGSSEGLFSHPSGIIISPDDKIIVADTGNNRIQVFDDEGNYLFHFGGSGSLPGQMRSPQGVAVDHFGIIYVADTQNSRVQIFSPTGVFMHEFSVDERPIDIAVDYKRRIFVLIPKNKNIVVYTPEGGRLKRITFIFDKRDYLERAQGLAVDFRGDIYFSESREHSLKKIDYDGKMLLSFGSEGETRGQFDYPLGLFVDSDEKVYVSDSKNKRVQIFKITGNANPPLEKEKVSPAVIDFDHVIPAEKGIIDLRYVQGTGLYALSDKNSNIIVHDIGNTIIGRYGKGMGEFKKPCAMDFKDKRIFVADTYNNRIQILNDDGSTQYAFGRSGSKNGQFNKPQGIVVDSQDRLYVADTENDRIQIFNNDSIFLKSFGGTSQNRNNISETGRFRSPTAVDIDSKDNLYVVDKLNNRVQIFDNRSAYKKYIGARGSAPNMFEIPTDISLDENDIIYVSDQGNSRVQIFNSDGLVLLFGSSGEGPGHFSKISAIDVYDNKIYTADYLSDQIKVFTYSPKGKAPKKPVVKKEVVAPKIEEKEEYEEEFELK